MMVSAIAVVFAVVFFVVGITTAYKGKGEQTVTFAVSILVAFVPEGCPFILQRGTQKHAADYEQLEREEMEDSKDSRTSHAGAR